MRRLTILEIVQEVLNDIDGDEVNSINDTLESTQIAFIARSVYEAMIDGRDWPHLYELFQLDGFADTDKPTHLHIPETMQEVEWFQYDKKKALADPAAYGEVKYKPPMEFMEYCNLRTSTASNIQVVTDSTGVKFHIRNDTAPQYFTSFDNDIIICDAFNADVEDTLHGSKTQCYGKRLPVFLLDDSFIPDLPNNAFAYYLNEVKSAASMKVRQVPDQKAEQYSITGRRRMSQEAWKLNNGIHYPDYGRKNVK